MPPEKTVTEYGQARHTDRGSEFIGHVAPAASVTAAEAMIEQIRAEYADATHNVPAYRVYEDEFLREYASDDGEPAGSAGDPMATVLSGQDLVDVVAVVTRYYGGTNLGIGGLVSAYTTATQNAIEAAGVTERQPTTECQITVPYDASGTVRGILEGAECDFEAAYEEVVTFRVQVPATDHEQLLERLRSATDDAIDLSWPDSSRETYTDGPA